MEDHSEPWVEIYRSTSEAGCRQYSLVLQAVRITHQVRWDSDLFSIWVAASEAARGREELTTFTDENSDEPVGRATARNWGDGWNGVLGFVAVLSAMAVAQKRELLGVGWFTTGRTDSGLIRGGEWWRTVTALTLHIDLEHVLSNLFFGGLVGLFAGQALGSGLAWCAILLAGGLGNLMNACLRPAGHVSIGASTAVFAALGLVASLAWQQRRALRRWSLERWAPIVGGVLLLSFLGTGGGRTDVGAHVLGFLCAIPFGVVLGNAPRSVVSSSRWQALFGLAALGILGGAWLLAITFSTTEGG
jgi:membrane associated rhomboid family serine protease